MDTNTLLALSAMGFVAWCIIMYQIIKAAVRSALNRHEYLIQGICRMEMKKMLEKGYSKKEIFELMQDGPDEFWNKLTSAGHG